MPKYLIIKLFLILFFAGFTFAQNKYYYQTITDTLPVNIKNVYRLSALSIVQNSEVIYLKGKPISNNYYSINYTSGIFNLSDELAYSIFDTLIIKYNAVIITLQREYKRRSLQITYDDKFRDTIRVIRSETAPFSADAIFGSGIEKSGTLVRGFSVGTTKDFTLNSGLRLQLSGRLSDEIEIVAALTDENTPIQPEGNTERLDELDKVFIQLKHPNASGTFGDYQIQKRYGEFGKVDRKLQGLLGEYFIKESKGYFSLAGSKGKFNTNLFNGTDGVQGPYRLSGANNERDIIIIAGTEKVFLDGEEQRRGEGNDYIIEYSNATITFTPNKLITSSSRITVDFEYTDRRYNRNFFAAGSESDLFNNKLNIQFQFVREGDDQDSPIDIALSEEDIEILSQAGNDRLKASKSGVTLAVPDSQGIIRGIYEKIDTVLNGNQYLIYKYSPGSSDAIYNVSFSFVGQGNGDYARESLGQFRFVGIGLGSFAPIILLPLPELKQTGNLLLTYKPEKDLNITFELAGSLYDRNRFSSIDDNENFGSARNLFIKLNPKNILFGNLDLGKIGFSYKDRFVQGKFASPDRFNEIEFERNYNLSGTSEKDDEQVREISLFLNPYDVLTATASYGYLKKGENFTSDRFNNLLRLGDNKKYNIDYNLDYVSSKNLLLTSKWLRQKGKAFYEFWILKPGMEFIGEDRKDFLNNDSLLNGSLRFNEFNPFIEFVEISGLSASIKYSLRDDFIPLNGIMVKESKSITNIFDLTYRGIREINTTLRFAFRNKKFTDEFKTKGFLDNETILIRSQTKYDLINKAFTGDLYYEVSTQRTARLQKVFVRVERGTGNYRYLGDLNNNGIADEDEFEPVVYDGDFIQITIPTDELFPVIDLKTSYRLKIIFKEFIPSDGIINYLFTPITTETFLRVEENSKEEDFKKIYFLDFNSFLNDINTIRGSNLIQQDFFLFENSSELSFRFRFSQRKYLNQFSNGLEKGFQRERSLRIRFKMVQEITNQTDLLTEDDVMGTAVTQTRLRNINTNTLLSDFSYRPIRNVEVGFKFKTATSTDSYPENPTILKINGQSVRLIVSLAGSGRLRFEADREELISNSTENFLPFELTKGNLLGKNYFWRLNFDYRLSHNLQSTLGYDGRSQGGGKVIHTARAEVRAYF